MNEGKKESERIDVTPDITFTPDTEFVVSATIAVEMDGVEGNASALEKALEDDLLVDSATVEDIYEELDALWDQLRDIRENGLVESCDMTTVVDMHSNPARVTIEGAYPCESPTLAATMFAIGMEGVVGANEHVLGSEVLGYSRGQQRERTIEETLSIDFESKKFVEHEDGNTECIEK
jgi:hypothetical protein